jgi:hypothetical protein
MENLLLVFRAFHGPPFPHHVQYRFDGLGFGCWCVPGTTMALLFPGGAGPETISKRWAVTHELFGSEAQTGAVFSDRDSVVSMHICDY